jgi:archaeosine synthase
MDFRIQHRDGPARIGQLRIQKQSVMTPNILYLQTQRCKAPAFAEILLTYKPLKTKKPAVSIGQSFFSKKEKKTQDIYLLYPMDALEEMHRAAFIINTKTEYVFLPAKKELIAEAVQSNNAPLAIVANAVQLFSHQTFCVDFLATARETLGYEKLIYLPCVGDPCSIALLTYLGVDLFDSFSAVMAARNDTLLFSTGAYKKNQLAELPCSCPSCSTIKDISAMTFDETLQHNYYVLLSEIKTVRNAIITGSLRELVEIRVRATPLLASMLRTLDLRHYPFLEERTPIVRKQPLLATTKDALHRPEVRRFQERVMQRFEKPASTKILLLLPCSAKKPYSFSKTHKLFRERIQSVENPGVVHEVILTSPLGLVPRELELTYPASCYDIAVTGHWDEDEKQMIRTQLQCYLQRNVYVSIILHIPSVIQEFIADLLPTPLSTCVDSPTSETSLNQLSEVLQNATRKHHQVRQAQRSVENIKALACYQFGKPLAESLLYDCTVKGKYPYQKIMYRDVQLGMITEERGLISLTLEGAKRLADAECYWVEIDDDVPLKGSVLAPGVKDADESIRIGDELIVRKHGVLCGVGVAGMNGREMKESCHGEAVKLRHHL